MADETEAISAIAKAMQGLEPDEAERVLRWAVARYVGDSWSKDPANTRGGRDDVPTSGADQVSAAEYARISDLMDAAGPGTGVEHALVGGYWFQIVQGQESFNGQEVNSELKDLGHGVKNITDTFQSLIDRKPPALRQIQKSGKTRQARKLYRLTDVGIKTVEAMIRGEADK